MSEYQYYEFLAIDRPLTSDEIAALRELSSRAHITPVSFTNEYQWGNFKGNPDKLMQRFFDAHVYIANWATAIFKVRLPIEAISEKTAQAMAIDDVLSFDKIKTHWVITWSLNESDNYDRFGMEDGRGWMARLAPVRDELLNGDIRSLYIGWLTAVTQDMMDDEDLEPLVVDGLGSLTAAQKALAEFLDVDVDLLIGAGIERPALLAEVTSQKEIDDWLDELPREEILIILKQLLEGQGQKAERNLKNKFAESRCGVRGDQSETPRRTIGELRLNAVAAEKIRIEQEKREKERREIKRRKERDAYLKTLAENFPKAWKSVQHSVGLGSGSAYKEACRVLVDLSDAYSVHSSRKTFQQELRKFMAGHMRRKALIQRLVKAGIWNE